MLDDYVDSFGPLKCKDDNPTLFLSVSVEIRCETSWTFGLTDSMDMSILCSLWLFRAWGISSARLFLRTGRSWWSSQWTLTRSCIYYQVQTTFVGTEINPYYCLLKEGDHVHLLFQGSFISMRCVTHKKTRHFAILDAMPLMCWCVVRFLVRFKEWHEWVVQWPSLCFYVHRRGGIILGRLMSHSSVIVHTFMHLS